MEGLKTTRVYSIFSTQSLVRPVLKEGSTIISLLFLLPDAILFLSSFEPEYDKLFSLVSMFKRASCSHIFSKGWSK